MLYLSLVVVEFKLYNAVVSKEEMEEPYSLSEPLSLHQNYKLQKL